YPVDEFDRYWFPIQGSNSTFIKSTSPLQSLVASKIVFVDGLWDEPPETVMDTALTSSGNITITFPDDYSYQYILWFYYAELNSTANASSRNFYIQVPERDILLNPYSNSSDFAFNGDVEFIQEVSYTPGTDIVLYPDQSVSSPLGPIANALETWEVSTNPMATITNYQDAITIAEIKSSMNLTDWTGDPCVPVPHPWVTCSTDINSVLSVTAVNLSGYNLTGPISPSFGNLLSLTSLTLDYNDLNGSLPLLKRLANLQYLFLQNNSLSGTIPDWLADLPSLSELFVWNNNFSGPIPPTLLSKNSAWNFMYLPGNPFLQGPSSISNKKSTKIAIIIGPVLGGILALVIIIFLVLCIKRKPHTKTKERTLIGGHLQMVKSTHGGANAYSIAQITIASENFKIQIGEGGFGPVYYGKLEDGQEVAIKVFDVKSSQGPSEFFNEVDILSRVSHQNLVSLIGYCLEDDQQILIYEYMHKGSLYDHLYGHLSTSTNEQLDWTTRLHIALNASQGLEYLHSGCNPSIIHRDVKTSNILLPSDMQNAKVADFGLSRLTYGENITHITTNVKGTTGYLDPEYFTSQYLSVKSDVYSFGVVLLEIISGRKAIDTTSPNQEAWNLCDWVQINLQEGNINKILDPIVKASNPKLDSVWKVAEIAVQCVEPKAIHRPIMTKVVEELQAAITFQEGNTLPSNYSHSMTYEIQIQSNLKSSQRKQGVCHTVALQFTSKSVLRKKKNYPNSNNPPCKNVIFRKSSKRNQNPSRCRMDIQLHVRRLMTSCLFQFDHVGANPYSLAKVATATNNFKIQIGKGGFGPVYYGKLEDGQEVAIKVLDVKSSQGPSEFFNEVDVLSRVSHRNLVALIGYCLEDDQQMLIYEYMHKGSLHDHLYGTINFY
ncbi:unnamed protein product, partial [Sphagnum troendelagicum]